MSSLKLTNTIDAIILYYRFILFHYSKNHLILIITSIFCQYNWMKSLLYLRAIFYHKNHLMIDLISQIILNKFKLLLQIYCLFIKFKQTSYKADI
jgi:hypothetical protein